jgi:hypothetical protein
VLVTSSNAFRTFIFDLNASFDVASTMYQYLRTGPDVAPFGDLSLLQNPKWFSLVRRAFLDGSPSDEAGSQIRLVAAGVVTAPGGAGGPGPRGAGPGGGGGAAPGRASKIMLAMSEDANNVE